MVILFSLLSDIDNDVVLSFKQSLQVLKQVVLKAKDVSRWSLYYVRYIRVF